MTALDNQQELPLDIAEQQKKRDEWAKKIKQYENTFDKWIKSGGKIVARYRDERDPNDSTGRTRKFNIFYSNVQTLGPAVYSKLPKPEVVRRYGDQDPIARVATAVLERALSYEMDVDDTDFVLRNSRDDYLTVGRGTAWQLYEPIIEVSDTDGDEDDEESEEALGLEQETQPEPVETLLGENAPTIYVHWKDFLHGAAQNWKQVPWVGRRVLVDREYVKKRWPDQATELLQSLNFTHRQEKDDDERNRQAGWAQQGNLALIYELWDKTSFTALWYSPDLKTRMIDEVPDPLQLNDFFPCPEPLFATMTTDRLIPRPDFSFYEDQANECDVLTTRIHLLTKALAVRGTYDASNTKLADLLNERPENFMVPVDNWAAFAEKGGLKGQMSFVPIDQVASVIQQLLQMRNTAKQDIYEITGIADIIRGASVASETATAQNIKGQFANMRLSNRRDAIAKFVQSILRIKAEVMCTHFQPDTLRKISGYDQMLEVKQSQDAEGLWQQVYNMLHDDPLRLIHIKVSIDTMIEADMEQEQGARVQFLGAAGQFLEKALQAAQGAPVLVPLLGQMLAWGVRGFKIGRELEASIDTAVAQLTQQAAQPKPPPPPDPDLVRAQTESDRTAQDIQNDQAKNALALQQHNDDIKLQQMKLASDERIAIMELNLKYGIQAAELAAEAVPTEEKELGP